MSTKTTQKNAMTTELVVAEKPVKENEASINGKQKEINYQVRAEMRQKGGTYFYSSATMGRKNIFVTPEYMDLLVNAIHLAEIRNDIKNLAFVVMPNYFHWMFRLSANQDDPMLAYCNVKKDVAKEAVSLLRQEAQEGATKLKMLDLFEKNDKVKRSQPRKILWDLKQSAKAINSPSKYKFWEPKSRLFLMKDEQGTEKNLKFIIDAPIQDRWQLVENKFDYPYLYISDEIQEKLKV